MESMSRLPVEQVLELIQDYDAWPIGRIKYIEECHCLMLQGQIAKIRQGFAKQLKEVSCQVRHSGGRIDIQPDSFSGKGAIASTTLLFGIAIDQGCKGRFPNAANACQCYCADIALG
jgi:hypothetical protein